MYDFYRDQRRSGFLHRYLLLLVLYPRTIMQRTVYSGSQGQRLDLCSQFTKVAYCIGSVSLLIVVVVRVLVVVVVPFLLL